MFLVKQTISNSPTTNQIWTLNTLASKPKCRLTIRSNDVRRQLGRWISIGFLALACILLSTTPRQHSHFHSDWFQTCCVNFDWWNPTADGGIGRLPRFSGYHLHQTVNSLDQNARLCNNGKNHFFSTGRISPRAEKKSWEFHTGDDSRSKMWGHWFSSRNRRVLNKWKPFTRSIAKYKRISDRSTIARNNNFLHFCTLWNGQTAGRNSSFCKIVFFVETSHFYGRTGRVSVLSFGLKSEDVSLWQNNRRLSQFHQCKETFGENWGRSLLGSFI